MMTLNYILRLVVGEGADTTSEWSGRSKQQAEHKSSCESMCPYGKTLALPTMDTAL